MHYILQIILVELSNFFLFINLGNHQHLSSDQPAGPDRPPDEQGVQRLGAAPVRRLTRRHALSLSPRSHPALPLPLPSHCFQGTQQILEFCSNKIDSSARYGLFYRVKHSII